MLIAASHSDRCLKSERPMRPSLSGCSFAHGETRAAVDNSRRFNSSQERCNCISASSSRARSSGKVMGLAFLFGRLQLISRPRECARQHFQIELEIVEEPAHRAQVMQGHVAFRRELRPYSTDY